MADTDSPFLLFSFLAKKDVSAVSGMLISAVVFSIWLFVVFFFSYFRFSFSVILLRLLVMLLQLRGLL